MIVPYAEAPALSGSTDRDALTCSRPKARGGERAETNRGQFHVLLVDGQGHAGHLAEDLHAVGFGVTWLLNGDATNPSGAPDSWTADMVVVQIPPDGRLSFDTLARAAKRAPGKPIVLAGDSVALPFIEEAVNWGVDDFVLYPCNVDNLSLRLTAVLRRWRAMQDDLEEAKRTMALIREDRVVRPGSAGWNPAVLQADNEGTET